MKVIRIDMPDGSQWDVPAEVIANHRADYYANKDPNYKERFKIEFKYTMSHDDEIMDWAENNLNWADVQPHAFRVSPPPACDHNAGWCNSGNKEILTIS